MASLSKVRKSWSEPSLWHTVYIVDGGGRSSGGSTGRSTIIDQIVKLPMVVGMWSDLTLIITFIKIIPD